MGKDRLLPCVLNPNEMCPVSCRNRRILSDLIDQLPQEIVDLYNEADTYQMMAEVIRERVASGRGLSEELKRGCLNKKISRNSLVQ